jgi:hypothetical protein
LIVRVLNDTKQTLVVIDTGNWREGTKVGNSPKFKRSTVEINYSKEKYDIPQFKVAAADTAHKVLQYRTITAVVNQ